MKRFFSLLLIILVLVFLSACSKKTNLYILNWGEYLDDDLVSKFEDEFGVRVVVDTSDTNEIMYTKIKAKTTKYDVAIPSDYMIHKLYNEDLLIKLDKELLPNYKIENFDPVLEALRDEYFEDNRDYAVPYFWGSLGIMYSTTNAGTEDIVKENDWSVLFDSSLTSGLKVGMYNSSRDAIAVAAFNLGYSIYTEDETELANIQASLKAQNYYAWGADNLKEMIAEGNLDIALVYSGDFFDVLYAALEDDLDINFGIHVPETNNIWFDAMVIPATSENQDLAHKFINFMIDNEHAYLNAIDVGYCPTLIAAYEMLQEHEDYKDIIEDYPFYPGIIDNAYIYKDMGTEMYQKYELILVNAKS